MTSPKRVDLLGMGIAPVDFFVSMRGYPSPGVKIDGLAGSHLIAGGGPVPNALCTFSRLGGNAALLTALGDDRWGRFARTELDKFKVDHTNCPSRRNCTNALAFIWVNITTGDRTIVLDIEKRLTLKPADIKLAHLPLPRLLHIDGRHVPACIKLARWGKKKGARIMLDVGSVRNRVDDLFQYTDYLICSDQYARHYHRTRSIAKAARAFKKLGIPEVVVTSGTAGSFGLDSDNNEHSQKAFRVRAIDVTGAGDVFHGAYLFGIVKDWPLDKKMRFAAAAAAIKCLKPGARAGIPTFSQVTAFIRKHREFYA